MGVRRGQTAIQTWPIVTLVLIVVNIGAFVATFPTMRAQQQELVNVKSHILMLAAAHPELDTSPEVRQFFSTFSETNPESWKALKVDGRTPADEWDARMLASTNEYTLQEQMDSLVGQYQAQQSASIADKYAFIPSAPGPISYITANFLYPGIASLALSVLGLLMVGAALEDAWGRVLFAAFFLAACAIAMQICAWLFPGVISPVMGASGAVTIMMGAMTARFPLRKISLGKFGIPALCFTVVWGAAQFLYFSRHLSREYVAVFQYPSAKSYWTTLAIAFGFGAVTGFVFYFLRIERAQAVKLQAARVYHTGSATLEAERLMDDGNMAAAEAILKDVLKNHPWAVDALAAMQQLHWRRNATVDYQEATVKLCQAYIRERDSSSAWHAYEEYLNGGGFTMPAQTWLELCRIAEEQHLFERCVLECEKLIALYPNTREALMAQLRAAKVCLKQLGEPQRSLKWFEAAQGSPIPHLDFEQAIANGIRESKVAISLAGSFPVMD